MLNHFMEPVISRSRFILALMLAALCAAGGGALAQNRLEGAQVKNPIYIADSPIASDSLDRLPRLVEQGNLAEAARLTDQIITELGGRLIESTTPGLYIQVSRRFEDFVLDHPALLDAYRTRLTPGARVRLAEGDWARVAREAWLTEPGMVAGLHGAQTLIEEAHFFAADRALIELERHPDARLHAKEAASLAALAARYIDDDDAWALAARWAAKAGTTIEDRSPIERPERVGGGDVQSTIDTDARPAAKAVSLEGIVPRALQHAPLTPVSNLDQIQNPGPQRLSGANWDPSSWIAPLVLRDRLFTNDGLTISCFDRFTLRPVWRVQTAGDLSDAPTSADARARLGRLIEDATTLTLAGDDLYAPTGIPRSGDRGGEARILKLDRATGRAIWSVDLQTLDPSLSDASIRGRLIVDEGIVVVGARTNNRKQRLISFSAVGLDAATGELRWIRQIGSAGSLPFQQMGQLAHSPVLDRGVVYWTEHIGLGFAIEAATGRLLWARALPPPDLYARSSRPSFSTNTPVLDDQSVFTLSTDGTEIYRLDRRTGATIAKRQAQPIGESLYLLKVGARIACVSPLRISLYPIDHFENGASSRSAPLGGAGGIRGRVIVMGEELLIPVENGIEIIHASSPERTTHIDLESTGNILALDGQIIVTDEMEVSSFLAWGTASALLEQRAARDPGAAVTLAELAYRSGRADETLPHVRRAIERISTLGPEPRRELEDELFEVVLDMVRPSPDAAGPGAALGSATRGALLDELGSLARTHEQVVAQRMALGAFDEQRGDAAGAIGAYQDILDQPALGSTMWEGAGIAMRGGLEATRRIGAILSSHGYAPYIPVNETALRERAFLSDDPDAPALETLARRYPWATSTPPIWREIARRRAGAGQLPSAIDAARQGIEAARTIARLGEPVDQETLDALGEIALTAMIETNRVKDAQILAAALVRDFPLISLRAAGSLITQEQIALAARRASQLPALGDRFVGEDRPMLLTGSPLRPGTRVDQGGVLLYAPQLGRLEYARARTGGFESVWSRHARSSETPIIPWQDESRTAVLWPQGAGQSEGGAIEAIETGSGRGVWMVDDLRSTLTDESERVPDAVAKLDTLFISPVHGAVPINQITTVTDGHTIIVSDRIGRAMGIDLFSGALLWKKDLPLNRVHDLDLAAGILGVCGLLVNDPAQGEPTSTSIVASIDARTGETIQRVDRFGQGPRWIRVAGNRNMYVATEGRIIAINTRQGSIDWVVKDENLARSVAGWIIENDLMILNESAQIWGLSLAQGTRSRQSLDLRQRVSARGWLRLSAIPDALMVVGDGGVAEFDYEHQLIASDPLEASSSIVDAALGAGRVALLQSARLDDEEWVSRIHLIDQDGARLLDTKSLGVPVTLDRQPTSITAVTGGVIVGYTEVSIFVPTLGAAP